MNTKDFFTKPALQVQRQYEALRAHYVDGVPLKKAAAKYGLSFSYLRKMITSLGGELKSGGCPFFQQIKPGPKKRFTPAKVKELILELRMQNLSIIDIHTAIQGAGHKLSLDTINSILAEEGLPRLSRRTRAERQLAGGVSRITPLRTCQLVPTTEEISTGRYGGVLLFLPLLERLGIIDVIHKIGFPQTREVSAVSYILSFLALKLNGNKRLAHDDRWSLERVLGLFAGLNVLPKASSMTSYSYRITRAMNYDLLSQLVNTFDDVNGESGVFNLDFKSIPHWGDMSILEKNYCTARGKSVKSVMALVVQKLSPDYIAYTNAEVKHCNQNDAVLEFVDFWKSAKGESPKVLVFDSQFTIYENLSKLNQDGIKFITLRRRREDMLQRADEISKDEWRSVEVEAAKGNRRTLKVFEELINLNHYEGQLRQIVFIDHSKKPVFIITNEFDLPAEKVIRKYGRRWLVEQEIAEQVAFFHLNQLGSSIVVKVDFDLTITVLAHNLYRQLAACLSGFEHCTAAKMHRLFVENRASVELTPTKITVKLGKRTHAPLLFEIPWLQEKTNLSWLGREVEFTVGTSS